MVTTAMLESFLSSPDFREGCIQATKAGYAGGSYVVELFSDASWRVVWSAQIGNLYKSEGLMITLPIINTDDYQEAMDGGMSEDEFYSSAFQCQEAELRQELMHSLGSCS